MINLIKDWECRSELESSVAQIVAHCLNKYLPADVAEIGWICKYYGINHRFDFSRGGQDVCMSRLNIKTDGKGIVTNITVG